MEITTGDIFSEGVWTKTFDPEHDVLIVIDPQIDFCPGGNLAVPGGDEIMSIINNISQHFKNVIITQDWHPKNHISFASSHEGKSPFDLIEVSYGQQVLWPDHCIQGTPGAEFHPDIMETVNRAKAIIRKGYNPNVDSYSAFFENDHKTRTGLYGFLQGDHAYGRRLYMVGLAYDYCVRYSAEDAREHYGYDVTVIRPATRAITEISADETTKRFNDLGIDMMK